MNEQNKKQVIVVAVLVVVLAAVLFYQMVMVEGSALPAAADNDRAASRRASRTAVPEEAVVLRDVDINFKELIESVEVKPIDYAESRILRNPMAPLVGVLLARPGATEQELPSATRMDIGSVASKQVSAIVWDEYFPVAIVDDTIVHEGYVYPDGTEIEAIEKTRVLFKVGEPIIAVEMKEF